MTELIVSWNSQKRPQFEKVCVDPKSLHLITIVADHATAGDMASGCIWVDEGCAKHEFQLDCKNPKVRITIERKYKTASAAIQNYAVDWQEFFNNNEPVKVGCGGGSSGSQSVIIVDGGTTGPQPAH